MARESRQLRARWEESGGQRRGLPACRGSLWTKAVEVGAEAADSQERGCVVICEDGELYELKMSIDFSEDAHDPVSARDETLKKLEGLHPRDYIVIAYEALTRLTEQIMERNEAAGG